MYKTYTKEEIKELLKKYLKEEGDKIAKIEECGDKYIACYKIDNRPITLEIEVVDTLTAIENEEPRLQKDKNDFFWSIIERLAKGKDLIQIGSYNKLAENLYLDGGGI